ncbi:putative Dehydrogenase/reductase SDR family member 11 [Hypsibius exemplaris]|uniref:Dehydrogenase/reductase SDR family member 11 n=1 Tax=Hypsibius exemplaris TaxID=2072580 RepID=A0A1W0WUB3_HYPEX|nr:putative Dehydrogenase/reductase SDR family member 11 [Hypsibius exemplaris]
MEQWRGKYALVTGASAGIGFTIAEGLLHNEEEILALFKEIQTEFRHADILVNNAGGGDYGTLTHQSTADWGKRLDLNVLSTAICTREALNLLEKNHFEEANIININSVAGHENIAVTGPGFNFCSGTKHMLTALTKALHTELVQKKNEIRATLRSPV